MKNADWTHMKQDSWLEDIDISRMPKATGRWSDSREKHSYNRISGDERLLDCLTDTDMQFIKQVQMSEIPEILPAKRHTRSMEVSFGYVEIGNVSIRNYVCPYGYYGVITRSFCSGLRDALPEDARVLDPLAGRGFAVKGFRMAGIPTMGSDDGSWHLNSDDIKTMDAVDAVRWYADAITHVLVSWAPYKSDVSTKILKECERLGLSIIHIGENAGGCTDSDSFFDAVGDSKVFDKTDVTDETGYLTYRYIHDRVTLLQHK